MLNRPSFDLLVGDIQQEVDFSTQKRLDKTWGQLAGIIFEKSYLDKIPIVISTNNSQPFTPDAPVIIPLLGGGRLEIGRIQQHYVYDGKQKINEAGLLMRIHAPSHRTKEQDAGKTFDCELTLSPYGGGSQTSINLLEQEKFYPPGEIIKQLNEARRFMALFNPEKDISWSELTSPTEQQSILLQRSGFHPPPVLPTI